MTPYEAVEAYRKSFPNIPRSWSMHDKAAECSTEREALTAKARHAADVDMRLAYLRKLKPKPVSFGQPRWQSWAETFANTFVGFWIAIASQVVVFPLFGIHVPLSTNLGIGCYFTAVSIARGQIMRRLFNALHKRQESAYIQQVAGQIRQ